MESHVRLDTRVTPGRQRRRYCRRGFGCGNGTTATFHSEDCPICRGRLTGVVASGCGLPMDRTRTFVSPKNEFSIITRFSWRTPFLHSVHHDIFPKLLRALKTWAHEPNKTGDRGAGENPHRTVGLRQGFFQEPEVPARASRNPYV